MSGKSRVSELFDEHIFTYIESTVQFIDSVEIMTEDTLNSVEVYPNGSLEANQRKVILKVSEPYTGLQKVYNKLPQPLLKSLQMLPYKHPTKPYIFLVMYIHSDYIDVQEQLVKLEEEHQQFDSSSSEIAKTIIIDFIYINNYSADCIQLESDTEPHKITVSNELIPYISEYTTAGIETVSGYVDELNLQINQVKYDGSSFTAVYKKKDARELVKYSRKMFLRRHPYTLQFKCNNCESESVGTSERMIGYCTVCDSTFTTVDLTTIDPTTSITQLQNQYITNYTTDRFNPIHQRKFYIPEDVSLLYSDPQVYTKMYDTLFLYFPDSESRVSIPVNPKTKQIASKSTQATGFCYRCGRRKELTRKLLNAHIYTGNIMYCDDCYICSDCSTELQSTVNTELERFPQLNSKLTLRRI